MPVPIMHFVTLRQKTSPPLGDNPSRMATWKERGATMVEFAIVAVWLFALIFIIVEGAFAVRARSTMSNAIDDAARRGAVAASAPNADYQIMAQLFGRGANAVADVEYVTVFRATRGNASIPAGCKAGVAQGEPEPCNVYRAVDLFDEDTGAFNADESEFNGVILGTQWPTAGRGFRTSATPDLEFIGVYVQAEYRFILQGLYKDNFTVNVSGQGLQAIETNGDTDT